MTFVMNALILEKLIQMLHKIALSKSLRHDRVGLDTESIVIIGQLTIKLLLDISSNIITRSHSQLSYIDNALSPGIFYVFNIILRKTKTYEMIMGPESMTSILATSIVLDRFIQTPTETLEELSQIFLAQCERKLDFAIENSNLISHRHTLIIISQGNKASFIPIQRLKHQPKGPSLRPFLPADSAVTTRDGNIMDTSAVLTNATRQIDRM